MADKQYTMEEVKAFMELAFKNDPASTTLPGAQLHGPLQDGSGRYGPLTYPGVRPEMLSAFQRPPSLSGALPLLRSDVASEIVEIQTGMTVEGGTNATGFCGDPPGPGALKVCQQAYAFGEYYVKDDLNAIGKVGLRKDRSDVQRTIMNNSPSYVAQWVPGAAFQLTDTFSQLAYEMYKIGVGVERDVCHVTIQGDTTLASAAAHHGWISEFSGLDNQIKTGYTDAITGDVCPAADSYVGSFNAAITGTDATTSRNIVQFISDMVYGITARAADVGMNGTQWAFVMRRDQFKPLIETWSCNYLTSRCSYASNNAQNQDAAMVRMMLDGMMAGNYLLVDGIQYPVIFDECIPRETLANQYYKADIYFVPLGWGGMPLTYFEYFDMGNPYSMQMTDMLNMAVERMNNGLWLVGERDTGLCVEHHYQMAVRLIVDAPFLAGRVDDVWYNFYAPSREAIPGSSLYVDGGTTLRT
jgi:hypothetical protein